LMIAIDTLKENKITKISIAGEKKWNFLIIKNRLHSFFLCFFLHYQPMELIYFLILSFMSHQNHLPL
jgi:TRAP-type mannitol/chloroaromatic compound transport system permease large subunit